MKNTSPKIKLYKDNVHLITFPKKKLYLIGTAHVSRKSVNLVKEIIDETEPDTIAIELDAQRYQNMLNKSAFENIDIIKIIKEKQLFFFIGQFILSSYQKRISEKTNSKPGNEFLKAVKSAKKLKANIVLADRNIGITLKRAYRSTPFFRKMKFLAGMLASNDKDIEAVDIEKLKKSDAIDEMVSLFANELPEAKRVLIDERDEYLISEILKNLGETTVAVVGAGHVPGMLKKINTKTSDERLSELNTIPPKTTVGKILPWVFPAIILSLFVWGFASGNTKNAVDSMKWWILAHGVLSSIGTLLAFGHPLTAITAFIASPITSLNPTIGVGFFTATVQTLVVRPRVKDFEQIRDLNFSFKKWWKNKVTRIFLVFIFSSIGSSIGTFVALPAFKKLFVN
jgi:pheromone shutdown-related protein TraB